MKHNLFHLCEETQTRQNPITAASVSKFSRVFKCSLRRRHLRIHSRSDFLHIYRVLNLVTYSQDIVLCKSSLFEFSVIQYTVTENSFYYQ
ncbi:hypothetical protein P8452_50619 [Trifolium repens]|nr:hypothetical protein P8452_50619 [Trifolium repens]